jgi:Domain of unknown function (DUF6379)
MFEKYMLCTDAFRPQPDGFQLDLRLPYYRGIPLSLIDKLEMRVDGVPVAPSDLTLELRGRRYSLDQLPSEFGERWEFGERATAHVRVSGGLSPGEHRISLLEQLRISYMPVPAVRTAEAVVTVE